MIDCSDARGEQPGEHFVAVTKALDLACGHHHRSIQLRWAGTIGSVAPSVAHQVVLDLDPHDDELDLWAFRLGLRPPKIAAAPPPPSTANSDSRSRRPASRVGTTTSRRRKRSGSAASHPAIDRAQGCSHPRKTRRGAGPPASGAPAGD